MLPPVPFSRARIIVQRSGENHAFARRKTRRPAKTTATFGGAAKKWLVLLYFQ
jgi:hypothetical protein